jgi:putative glutamine amidotransferase
VLLPPGGTDAEAAATVAALDGVLLAGGADVDPGRYGEQPHPRTVPVNPSRDAWEFAVVEAALGAGVPLLAICRGMQLLNVFLGGTLHQHLPDIVDPDVHGGLPKGFGRHPVHISGTGRLSRILGDRDRDGEAWLDVPTHHHQAVDKLGAGLTATAWAADGIVEAIEVTSSEGSGGDVFAVGVQWHPEEGDDPRLLEALARAAAQRRP